MSRDVVVAEAPRLFLHDGHHRPRPGVCGLRQAGRSANSRYLGQMTVRLLRGPPVNDSIWSTMWSEWTCR